MPQLDGQVARYEDRLRSRLAKIGAVIPAPPDVPHLSLVDRAVSRTKPFGDSGSGYRDALIWETVLMYASSGDVVLVTSNAGDFAASNDAVSPVASDLQHDLNRIGEADDRVLVCRSPVAAIEHLFVRNEKLLDVLRLIPPITTERLIGLLPPVLQLTSKAGLQLPEGARVFGVMNLEVASQLRSVDHGDEEIEQEYDPLEVLEATYLSDGLAAIRLLTRVIAGIDYSLPGASDNQVGVGDDSQDANGGIPSAERELTLEVFAEFNVETNEVRPVDLVSLKAP